MKIQPENTKIQTTESNLMDIKELAALLNVKESWIRSKVFDGSLKYIKLGRLVRFNRKDIEKWLSTRIAGELNHE